jgi:indolepyruvate ferredoxin oxidoreductase beta subunit
VIKAIEDHAQSHLVLDMAALAKEAEAMINAVMLGIIAGCGRLPLPAAAYEAAIRADGKAVETNLKGFRSGLEAAHAARQGGAARAGDIAAQCDQGAAASLADLEREIVAGMPAVARDVILAGTRRLAAYQDAAYARLYIDRLARVRTADERAQAGGRLLRESARHLAVRMSYEDVIRVAQVKIDPARLARIAAEAGARPGEPVTVTEFLKPGVEELCSILPPAIATRILAAAARRGLVDRLHWGMEVDTTSISGFLRFWALAKLRRWRPRSYRFREEQGAIEAWLGLILEAARLSGELALEVAECARLIKGYGDTLKRGAGNYRVIEARVIRPVLAGSIPLARGLDAIASARAAALADPEGEALVRCLAELEEKEAMRIAAE